MKIGIFSDVHDQLENLKKALDFFDESKLTTIVFCGDFCSPIAFRMLLEYPSINFNCIFGNNDADRYMMMSIIKDTNSHINILGEYAELKFDTRKIAVTHYPFYAQALAECGRYDVVFSGHTHVNHVRKTGNCLWINPGEIMGWKGIPTCAVYDTVAHDGQIFKLI